MSNSVRLSRIDATHRGAHSHLHDDDVCLFLYEYTSHKDYSYSETNSLISNLKKSPLKRGTAEWSYKEAAIQSVAKNFRDSLHPNWLEAATIVPMPGSKAVGHPEFDDRMTRIARLLKRGMDVRDLVVPSGTIRSAHECGSEGMARPTVQELQGLYSIDEELAEPAPTHITILDDVITAGTHFRAVHDLLRARFPTAQIIGLFVARRVFPPEHEDPNQLNFF